MKYVIFAVILAALSAHAQTGELPGSISIGQTEDNLHELPPETNFGADIAADMGYSNYDGFQPGVKASLQYRLNTSFSAGAGFGYYTADWQTRTGPLANLTLTYWRGEKWSAFLRGEMNWYSIVDEEKDRSVSRSFRADYANAILGFGRTLSQRTSMYLSLNYGERIDERSADDNFSSLSAGMGYFF